MVPERSKRERDAACGRAPRGQPASQPANQGRTGRLASSPPRRSRNRTTRPVRRSRNGAELAGGAHPVQESESDLSGVVPCPGGKKISVSGLQFPTDTLASLAVGPARCRLPTAVLRSRSRGTSHQASRTEFPHCPCRGCRRWPVQMRVGGWLAAVTW